MTRKAIIVVLAFVLAFAGVVTIGEASAVEGSQPVACGTPATEDVYEDREVVVKPGEPAVPPVTQTIPGKAAVWQNFSPNKDQGPFEGPPSWPTDLRGTWQHQDKPIPPGQNGPDGVYQNGVGNGSWFYRAAAVPEQVVVITPGKDAVPPVTEIQKVLVKEGTPAGPPCPEDPETPVDKPETPSVDSPESPQNEREVQAPRISKRTVEVPTAVDAGI